MTVTNENINVIILLISLIGFGVSLIFFTLAKGVLVALFCSFGVMVFIFAILLLIVEVLRMI